MHKDIDDKIATNVEKLSSYSTFTEKVPPKQQAELKKVREEFERKFRSIKNRSTNKANVAIIGTMKAGKSNIINHWVFRGQNIMPTNDTPESAKAAEIRAGETSKGNVIFYKPEEWNDIERLAQEYQKSPNESSLSAKGAFEILSEAEKNMETSELKQLLGKESEVSIKDLAAYISKSGKYTPIVKKVIVYHNNPVLSYCTIMDTPGLHDPVLSRSLATRDFMSMADLVIFCSTTGQFLNEDEVTEIIQSLPQNGISEYIILATRFDEDLWDDGATASFEEKQHTLLSYLVKRKNTVVAELEHKFEGNEVMLENIQKLKNAEIIPCSIPIEIAILGIAIPEDLQHAYNNLCNLYPKDEIFHSYKLVTTLFDKKVRAKINKLEEDRAKDIENLRKNYPESFNKILREIVEEIQKDIYWKQGINDTAAYRDEVKQYFVKLSELIKTKVTEDLKNHGESANKLLRKEIDKSRKDATDYNKISDRTESVPKSYNEIVFERRWYTLWLYRHETKITHYYNETYYYGSIDTAIKNLDEFEKVVQKQYDIVINANLNKVCVDKIIRNIFEEYINEAPKEITPILTKALFEALSKLKIPDFTIRLDTSPLIKEFGKTGEVCGESNIKRLNKVLNEIIAQCINTIPQKIEDFSKEYSQMLQNFSNRFWGVLEDELNAKLTELESQLANKQAEIDKLNDVVRIVQEAMIK